MCCTFQGGEAPPSHFSSRIQGEIQAFNEDKMEEKDIPLHKLEIRSPLIKMAVKMSNMVTRLMNY
jgi:hypothetical protein